MRGTPAGGDAACGAAALTMPAAGTSLTLSRILWPRGHRAPGAHNTLSAGGASLRYSSGHRHGAAPRPRRAAVVTLPPAPRPGGKKTASLLPPHPFTVPTNRGHFWPAAPCCKGHAAHCDQGTLCDGRVISNAQFSLREMNGGRAPEMRPVPPTSHRTDTCSNGAHAISTVTELAQCAARETGIH